MNKGRKKRAKSPEGDGVAMKKRAQSRKKMIVTTIALDRALHRRLLRATVTENSALTELIRQAITKWLDTKRQPTGRVGR